jgi:hypothetical protein
MKPATYDDIQVNMSVSASGRSGSHSITLLDFLYTAANFFDDAGVVAAWYKTLARETKFHSLPYQNNQRSFSQSTQNNSPHNRLDFGRRREP